MTKWRASTPECLGRRRAQVARGGKSSPGMADPKYRPRLTPLRGQARTGSPASNVTQPAVACGDFDWGCGFLFVCFRKKLLPCALKGFAEREELCGELQS